MRVVGFLSLVRRALSWLGKHLIHTAEVLEQIEQFHRERRLAEGIAALGPLDLALDHAERAQVHEMLREVGLGDGDELIELADAARSVLEHAENAEPRWVPDPTQEVGGGLVLAQQRALRVIGRWDLLV
jgi:hypothetical protein